jgi:hypothetical protein
MHQMRWESDRRYYAARVYPDMLGDWVVERAWGGLFNKKGNSQQEVVPSYKAAIAKMLAIHMERRARKYRIVMSR